MNIVVQKIHYGTLIALENAGAGAPGPTTISEDGKDKEQP